MPYTPYLFQKFYARISSLSAPLKHKLCAIACVSTGINSSFGKPVWIPDVVRARQTSERWRLAYDTMRHNGYDFHNAMVQDWADFLDDGGSSYMSLLVHYGGEWKNTPDLDYVDGKVRIFDELPNDFDVGGLKRVIASLGYDDIIKLHYCDSSKTLQYGRQERICTSTRKRKKELDKEVASLNSGDVIDDDLCKESDRDYGHLLPSSPKHMKRKTLTHSAHMLTLRPNDDGHFFLGQLFQGVVEFRKALTNYSVSTGRDLVFTRNTKVALGARCRLHELGCPCYIWASVEKKNGTMYVKTLVLRHTCGRVPKRKKIKAKWVAENYYTKFNVNPYLRCQEIVDTIWSEFGVKDFKKIDGCATGFAVIYGSVAMDLG
uniref:Transposase MuDR plant domain-containing protein n=1 Tax=Chenopodium quinoa TaxID=63459 RepID=A0A803MWC5_CHEQI